MTEPANSTLRAYQIPIFAVYTLKFKRNCDWAEIEIQVRRDKKVIETLSHAIEKAKKIHENKKFEFVRFRESYETVIFYL